MRLDEILTAAPVSHATLKLIYEQCKPYIDRNPTINLLRGTYQTILEPTTLNVRFDRKPRDTLPAIHTNVNAAFERVFHYPYRTASVFGTLDDGVAFNYGMPASIIPIGQYTVCYSDKIHDLTIALDRLIVSESAGVSSFVTFLKQAPAIADEEEQNIEDFMMTLQGNTSSQSRSDAAAKMLPNLFYKWVEYVIGSLYVESKEIPPHLQNEIMVACKQYWILPAFEDVKFDDEATKMIQERNATNWNEAAAYASLA